MASILLIDDEEGARYFIKTVLEKEGHTVYEAGDGIIGEAILSKKPVELIITDLLMPNKDGIEVILNVQEKYPDIKVIAVSGGGHSGMFYLAEAELVGASASLKKPFTANTLISTVKQVLAG